MPSCHVRIIGTITVPIVLTFFANVQYAQTQLVTIILAVQVLSTVLWTLFLVLKFYLYIDNMAFLPRPISANPLTKEEKLPNCMQLREEDPYPTSAWRTSQWK